MKRRIKSKVRLIAVSIVLVLLIALAGVLAYILQKYKVTTIYVSGNTHYTDEEIIDYVMTDRLSYNSVYLSLKYKNKEITGVPFVQSMDVSILTPDTIKITVYEKSLAGYVFYLGRYLYFDKDGIIVESSNQVMEGIPRVSGLQFTSVTLYQELPVENTDIFKSILSITQLLSKYKLTADRIGFDAGNEMTIYFGDVRVSLGTSDYIDEKITQLQHILPDLTGLSGVLDMRDYQDSEDTVTFISD